MRNGMADSKIESGCLKLIMNWRPFVAPRRCYYLASDSNLPPGY